MIDNVGIAPLRAMRCRAGILANRVIQHHVVQLIIAEPRKCLVCELSDLLQVQVVDLWERNVMLGRIVLQAVVLGFRLRWITDAQDEAVRLRLVE